MLRKVHLSKLHTKIAVTIPDYRVALWLKVGTRTSAAISKKIAAAEATGGRFFQPLSHAGGASRPSISERFAEICGRRTSSPLGFSAHPGYSTLKRSCHVSELRLKRLRVRSGSSNLSAGGLW